MLLFQFLYTYLIHTYNQTEIRIIQLGISTFHALFTSILSTGFVLNLYNDAYFLKLISVSFGFALFDINYHWKHKVGIWKQMVFHHILILLSSLPLLYEDFLGVPIIQNYYYMLARNYMSEISTITLNCIWFYHYTNRIFHRGYILFCILTLINFFVFRIINGSFLVYVVLMNYRYTALQYAQYVVYFMNCIWFYKLYQKWNNTYIQYKIYQKNKKEH